LPPSILTKTKTEKLPTLKQIKHADSIICEIILKNLASSQQKHKDSHRQLTQFIHPKLTRFAQEPVATHHITEELRGITKN